MRWLQKSAVASLHYKAVGYATRACAGSGVFYCWNLGLTPQATVCHPRKRGFWYILLPEPGIDAPGYCMPPAQVRALSKNVLRTSSLCFYKLLQRQLVEVEVGADGAGVVEQVAAVIGETEMGVELASCGVGVDDVQTHTFAALLAGNVNRL